MTRKGKRETPYPNDAKRGGETARVLPHNFEAERKTQTRERGVALLSLPLPFFAGAFYSHVWLPLRTCDWTAALAQRWVRGGRQSVAGHKRMERWSTELPSLPPSPQRFHTHPPIYTDAIKLIVDSHALFSTPTVLPFVTASSALSY